MDSRDEAGVCRQQHTWAPQIELEGTPISWDASIRESQRRHANHLAQALEQPLLLPRDIEAFQRTMQPDLFMSLKRDLALVSYFSPFSNAKSIFPLSLSSSSSLNPLLFFCRSFSKFMWPRNGFKMLITSLKLSLNLSTRLRKLSGP